MVFFVTFARVGAVRVLTEKHPTDGVWLPGYVTSDVKQLPHECLLVVDPDGIYEGLGISLDETYAARRRERKKNARSLGEPNTCESKNSDAVLSSCTMACSSASGTSLWTSGARSSTSMRIESSIRTSWWSDCIRFRARRI